jgi:hypothetical protein
MEGYPYPPVPNMSPIPPQGRPMVRPLCQCQHGLHSLLSRGADLFFSRHNLGLSCSLRHLASSADGHWPAGHDVPAWPTSPPWLRTAGFYPRRTGTLSFIHALSSVYSQIMGAGSGVLSWWPGWSAIPASPLLGAAGLRADGGWWADGSQGPHGALSGTSLPRPAASFAPRASALASGQSPACGRSAGWRADDFWRPTHPSCRWSSAGLQRAVPA